MIRVNLLYNLPLYSTNSYQLISKLDQEEHPKLGISEIVITIFDVPTERCITDIKLWLMFIFHCCF